MPLGYGRGEGDPLRLVVEIKGRREDAKEKKAAMTRYSVSGVNNHRQYGLWILTEVYRIEPDFEAKVETERENMVEDTLESEGLAMAGEQRP